MFKQLLLKVQVKSAQATATRISKQFTTSRNALLKTNETLRTVVQTAEDDILRIRLDADDKIAVIRSHQTTAYNEMRTNERVAAKLEGFVR
jgi:hypothetical protein